MPQRTVRLFAAACAAAVMLTFCGVQVFAQTPSWGEVRVAEHPVSVRHKPDAASTLVRTLRVGDTVRAVPMAGGWAELYDMTESRRDATKAMGYAPLAQLTPQAQAHVPAPVKRSAAQRPAAAATGSSEVMGEVQQPVGGGKPLLSGSAPSSGPQDPVRITSDRMVYSQNENAVIFLGNVHGTQKDMAIWAAKITAYFSEKNKDAKGGKGSKGAAEKQQAPKQPQAAGGSGEFGDKIERIVAEGSVRLVAGKNEGACARLIYFVPEGVLRMEGNPILREGKSTVRGDVIKFYLHENRSEVLSGTKKRVEAIFYQEQQGGGK